MQTTPGSLTGYSLELECRPLIRPQLILGLLSLVPPKLLNKFRAEGDIRRTDHHGNFHTADIDMEKEHQLGSFFYNLIPRSS